MLSSIWSRRLCLRQLAPHRRYGLLRFLTSTFHLLCSLLSVLAPSTRVVIAAFASMSPHDFLLLLCQAVAEISCSCLHHPATSSLVDSGGSAVRVDGSPRWSFAVQSVSILSYSSLLRPQSSVHDVAPSRCVCRLKTACLSSVFLFRVSSALPCSVITRLVHLPPVLASPMREHSSAK